MNKAFTDFLRAFSMLADQVEGDRGELDKVKAFCAEIECKNFDVKDLEQARNKFYASLAKKFPLGSATLSTLDRAYGDFQRNVQELKQSKEARV